MNREPKRGDIEPKEGSNEQRRVEDDLTVGDSEVDRVHGHPEEPGPTTHTKEALRCESRTNHSEGVRIRFRVECGEQPL